jgi:hypothetical protein
LLYSSRDGRRVDVAGEGVGSATSGLMRSP